MSNLKKVLEQTVADGLWDEPSTEYSNFSNIEWKLKERLEQERKRASKENPFVGVHTYAVKVLEELLHEQDDDEAGSV